MLATECVVKRALHRTGEPAWLTLRAHLTAEARGEPSNPTRGQALSGQKNRYTKNKEDKKSEFLFQFVFLSSGSI
jgi:hypothetical protein